MIPGNYCETCEFYRRLAEQVGECRRHAPVLNEKKTAAVWPMVTDNDFCGDYKRAPQTVAD